MVKLLNIEKNLGRLRHGKNDPRTCDIDIVDFNNRVIYDFKNKLFSPHKSMHRRNFVLIPLLEISKNWFHPKLRKNIVFLLSNLSSEQLLGIKIVQ